MTTQKLRNPIDNGILDKEYYIISKYEYIAENNIKKKRGIIRSFLKNFTLFIFPPMSIDSPRWDDKEVELEYERLMAEKGNAELHKLRPDLY